MRTEVLMLIFFLFCLYLIIVFLLILCNVINCSIIFNKVNKLIWDKLTKTKTIKALFDTSLIFVFTVIVSLGLFEINLIIKSNNIYNDFHFVLCIVISRCIIFLFIFIYRNFKLLLDPIKNKKTISEKLKKVVKNNFKIINVISVLINLILIIKLKNLIIYNTDIIDLNCMLNKLMFIVTILIISSYNKKLIKTFIKYVKNKWIRK